MSIKRILLLSSMALAAIAFAAPAVSHATVLLTDSKGKVLKAGAKITATSTDLITTTGLGTLECAKVTLHFEVLNPGGTAAGSHVVLQQGPGEAETTATTEKCDLNTGAAGKNGVTITDGTVGVGEEHKLTINTWGTGVAKAKFVSDIYTNTEVDPFHQWLVAECTFEGNVAVQGAASNTDILNVETSKVAGPCGEGEMHGSFTLETSNGVAVTLDFTKTP